MTDLDEVYQETLLVMKTFKKLVILCIVSGFVIESLKAQLPCKMSYQTVDKITFLSEGNLNPIYGRLITPQINRQNSWVHSWIDLTKKTDFTINTTYRNYYNFIGKQTLLNRTIVKFPIELTAMEEYGTTNTFNIKRESLNGIPFIDPAIAYYCPYKRTGEPTLCSCHLYRVAAFVIPRMLQFKYPGAHSTIIYPQAYLQTKYP
jgi:hypothetical protein